MSSFFHQLAELLIQYGSMGMFVSAFLAGTVLPFSSELVLVGLVSAGSPYVGLVLYGAVGNTLGGVLNYWIGSLGKEEWIYKYARITPAKLERGMRQVRKYGVWTAFFAWVPVLGSVLTLALGYLRVNPWWVTVNMFVGKIVRYGILAYICLRALGKV